LGNVGISLITVGKNNENQAVHLLAEFLKAGLT